MNAIAGAAAAKHVYGLSGNSDYVDLTERLQNSRRPGTPIQLVHGEPDAADALRLYLKNHTRFNAQVAQYRSIVRV